MERIKQKLNSGVWLLVSESQSNSIETILRDLPVLMNCQLLVAFPNNLDWILDEAYYRNPKLPLTVSRIGIVQPKRQSHLDKRSLIMRRINFQGLVFTVAVIKVNILNLILIAKINSSNIIS